MIIAINARRASSPSICRISATFLYTSPTKGVVGPKTTPSSNVTATNGNNNLVSLLKKAVTLQPFFLQQTNMHSS